MKKVKISVKIGGRHSHNNLLSQLEPCFKIASKGTQFVIEIDLNHTNFIHSDKLLFIIAAVKYARSAGSGVDVRVLRIDDRSKLSYVQRMNFFKELGITEPEKFRRWNSEGRFLPIQSFCSVDYLDIPEKLNNIISTKIRIEKSAKVFIDYCLCEIVDNVINHSKSPFGWVVAQSYPAKGTIRILVLDLGIGIHESLTGEVESEFSKLSPKEALAICANKGVTRGREHGVGNGLFHTSELIKLNQGNMTIYSGEHALMKSINTSKVIESPFFRGTAVYLNISSRNPVDYGSVLGAEYGDYYDERYHDKGKNNKSLTNLW